ncbi:hypothetical protein HBB16_19970 [Pseudonocardia sp. MCCB 268]|nr:hypothetical protein [Pseudonocardia cytotoxica]
MVPTCKACLTVAVHRASPDRTPRPSAPRPGRPLPVACPRPPGAVLTATRAAGCGLAVAAPAGAVVRHDRFLPAPDPLRHRAGARAEQQKYGTVMDTAGTGSAPRPEVGCGGRPVRLAGTPTRSWAWIICPAAVERVGRAGCCRRRSPGGRRLEMPDGTFDLIVCTDVLYYWGAGHPAGGASRPAGPAASGKCRWAYHYRGDSGQAGTADRAHEALVGRRPRAGTWCPGTRPGTGSPRARPVPLSDVVAPAPVGDRPVTGVPEPRCPVTGTPAPSPRLRDLHTPYG